jgi:hypothetical protein
VVEAPKLFFIEDPIGEPLWGRNYKEEGKEYSYK